MQGGTTPPCVHVCVRARSECQRTFPSGELGTDALVIRNQTRIGPSYFVRQLRSLVGARDQPCHTTGEHGEPLTVAAPGAGHDKHFAVGSGINKRLALWQSMTYAGAGTSTM